MCCGCFPWQILLANKGIINSGLAWAGFENLQFHLLYTQIATRIGLIHYLAPILIVVLYVTVAKHRSRPDPGGGARPSAPPAGRLFRRVILPMSRTGLLGEREPSPPS